MSLQGRRGAILQEPSRLQRINNYFALPVSLSLDEDSTFKHLLDLGKGVVHSIGSKFIEILTPKLELSVQTRPVTIPEKTSSKPSKVEKPLNSLDLPVKRMPDSSALTVKKRIISRINAEVQTDLPYEPKPKGNIHRLDLIRNYEITAKNCDPAAEVDTKGTDEDDEELGFRRIAKKKKIKVWIHRGPSLEIIPERKIIKNSGIRNELSKKEDFLPFATKNDGFSQSFKEEIKKNLLPETQKNGLIGFNTFPPKSGKVIPESKAEDGAFGRKRTVFEGFSSNRNFFDTIGFGTSPGSESKTENLQRSDEKCLDFSKNDKKTTQENFSLFSSLSAPLVNPESKNTLISALSDVKKEVENNENGQETPRFDTKESVIKVLNDLNKPKISSFVPASPPPAHLSSSRLAFTKNVSLFTEIEKSSESESKSIPTFESQINPFLSSCISTVTPISSSQVKKQETCEKTENKILPSQITENSTLSLQKLPTSNPLSHETVTSTSPSSLKPSDPSSSSALLNSAQSVSSVKQLDSISAGPVSTSNPLSASSISIGSSNTTSLPPRTVIENYQSNPFLNSSFTSTPVISYRFGEIRPESALTQPIPQVQPFKQVQVVPQVQRSPQVSTVPQVPTVPQVQPAPHIQANPFEDIEMDSSSSFMHAAPSFSNQTHNFQNISQSSPPVFQPSFNPLSFGTSFVPAATGIFGSQTSGNNASVNKSNGFNLGIISGNQLKRGRK